MWFLKLKKVQDIRTRFWDVTWLSRDNIIFVRLWTRRFEESFLLIQLIDIYVIILYELDYFITNYINKTFE